MKSSKPFYIILFLLIFDTSIIIQNYTHQQNQNLISNVNTTHSLSSAIESLAETEQIALERLYHLKTPELSFHYSIFSETISQSERELLARLVFLEARNQSLLGQKAVVEVVLNRVLSEEFPNTIYDVIFDDGEFSLASDIEHTTPTQKQYDAVNEVLSEYYPVLDDGVLFFATKQYNDYLYEKIGDHYFCYSKKSYELHIKENF